MEEDILLMSADYTNVLRRLREERTAHGLTQREMGSQIGISQGHYSKAEQAVKRFTYQEMKRLAETDLDLYYIYTGKKVRQRNKELLKRCSYRELLCYLNMTASIASCMYDEKKLTCEKDFYQRLRCVKCLSGTDGHSGETVFSLIRRLEKETQCGIAGQLGIDTKRYRQLERGNSFPDSELIWMLYERYKVLPAFVLQDAKGISCELEYLLERLTSSRNGIMLKYLRLLHKYYSLESST